MKLRPSIRVMLALALTLGIWMAAWAAPPADAGAAAPPTEPSENQGTRTAAPEELPPHQILLRTLFSPIINWFPVEKTRRDLTLRNFFSYGWQQGWEEPPEGPHDAPRFSLLRIKRAFFERELRFAYTHTFRADKNQADALEGEFELELPLSRRLLVEFEGGMVGQRPSGKPWRGGGGDLKVTPEIMLVDTRSVSFSSGLVIRTPTGSRALGEGLTSLTPYLAFWKDLGHRLGLHTYLGTEFPTGGFAPGHPAAILQYGLAPALTVTPKNKPLLGNLTFFLEINGESELGSKDDQTVVTLLPGSRWLVYKDIWLALGYEIPLTATNELHSRLWTSLYLDF